MRSAALAHLRFSVKNSRGRRYPEPAHPYRNDFQRDRDRIVHARAFRRLENKTQVFTPGLSDHFRNRLTHTIEVSQIARTVASALGLNEDLTEALSLAHDIGHPPFGHAGEHALDRLMRPYGERFDHNLHALRIVEVFERPYARFPGLNLTFEVREGIVKHSRDLAPGEFPELDEYLRGERPPLEAQLIDLCDEIAYNAADLDDGYAAGLIDFERARGRAIKFRELDDAALRQFPSASERVRLHEIVRGLIDWLVSGLIEGTIANARNIPDVQAVRTNFVRLARFSPETAAGSAELKALLRETVYESSRLAEARRASVGRIAALFNLFMDQPGLLPLNYLEETAAEPMHRRVCDYIAGMTDRFLVKTWEKFFGQLLPAGRV
ncbi:MAG: dGTP triphosphohydrolase [Bryobacteraceae bacterium]